MAAGSEYACRYYRCKDEPESVTIAIAVIVISGGYHMARTADDLLATIKSLPDTEKLKLVDEILIQLDKPDPEIDSFSLTMG